MTWVQSLVRELSSCKPRGSTKKKRERQGGISSLKWEGSSLWAGPHSCFHSPPNPHLCPRWPIDWRTWKCGPFSGTDKWIKRKWDCPCLVPGSSPKRLSPWPLTVPSHTVKPQQHQPQEAPFTTGTSSLSSSTTLRALSLTSWTTSCWMRWWRRSYPRFPRWGGREVAGPGTMWPSTPSPGRTCAVWWLVSHYLGASSWDRWGGR